MNLGRPHPRTKPKQTPCPDPLVFSLKENSREDGEAATTKRIRNHESRRTWGAGFTGTTEEAAAGRASPPWGARRGNGRARMQSQSGLRSAEQILPGAWAQIRGQRPSRDCPPGSWLAAVAAAARAT